MSTLKACHGALGGPFFDHFFASILDSILDSIWARLGLVLGSLWHLFGRPNRVESGLESIFPRKHRFLGAFLACAYAFACGPGGRFFDPKTGPRSPQDRSKTGPRAIKKRCIFRLDFGLVLRSFWDLFGRHLELQNRPIFLHRFTLNGLVFDLALGWSQDGRHDRPKTVQEPSRTAQNPLNGRFGSSWGRLRGRFESFLSSID